MTSIPFIKSIRGRIILFTAFCTVVLTMAAVSICFYVFQTYQAKASIQSCEFNLQVVSDRVSSDMNHVLSFSKWCSTSSDVTEYMDTIYGKGALGTMTDENPQIAALAFDTYDRIWEEYTMHNQSNFIRRLILSTDDTSNYMQMFYSSVPDSPKAARLIKNQPFFQTLYDAPAFQWIGLVQNPFNHVSNDPIIPVIRPVYSSERSGTTGWVYLELSPDLLLSLLRTYPMKADSRLILSIGGHDYRYEEGTLVSEKSPYKPVRELHGCTMNPSSHVSHVTDDTGARRTLLSTSLGIPGWEIRELLSEEQLQEQQTMYYIMIAGICAAIISLGILLALFLNRSIVGPVQLLLNKLHTVSQGDFRTSPEIEWENELGEIGRGINDLSENVVALMNTRIESEKQKKDLEYQILQSQINPHFLYNTLNSVKWMATIQGAAGIADFITVLARLLKNVSKGSTAMIPLSQELDLVQDYFRIQQYRYGSSISLTYELESEELSNCLVHRFSLQPMVENALFHGLEPKHAPGTIMIKGKSLTLHGAKHLIITVTDDGVGMSEEAVRTVLSGDLNSKSDFFRHIGISNVNSRIQYDFGETYGISIESEPGSYTTMILDIPWISNNA